MFVPSSALARHDVGSAPYERSNALFEHSAFLRSGLRLLIVFEPASPQNFLNAATACGLSCSPMEGIDEIAVRKVRLPLSLNGRRIPGSPAFAPVGFAVNEASAGAFRREMGSRV